MTDLEMTRLCAEAMESPPTTPGGSDIWGVSVQFAPEYKLTNWVRSTYDPLHDDAQAMALVKRFQLLVNNGVGSRPTAFWHVQTQDDRDESVESTDLNRAIVECVAKMQQAKKAASDAEVWDGLPEKPKPGSPFGGFPT